MKPQPSKEPRVLGGKNPYPRISSVREIGRGRGAVARLVKIQDSSGKTSLGVEKIFRAGRLTRLIYWLLFQSPFPYRSSLDAIRACYYRRRVAASLIRFAGIDIGVAAPYYTRWSEDDSSFVLGAEFIDGQGLAVDNLDPRMLRRLFYNHILCPIARVLGRALPREASPDSEAGVLTSRMKDLEVLFRRSGLVGSGWQVCPQTLVATSNFVKTRSQYVLVDLESGIPALLAPYYLFYSIFHRRFPLFDDVDENRLRAFLDSNQSGLQVALGAAGYGELKQDAESLISHSQRWKTGEVALFRNGPRLLSYRSRRAIKEARVAWWMRRRILDETGKRKFLASHRFFSTGVYLSGVMPGSPGRLLRGLKGNHKLRAQVTRFLIDKGFRKNVIRDYISSQAAEWRRTGRVPPQTVICGVGGGFLAHFVFSRAMPPSWHRFLGDRSRRKQAIKNFTLLLTSEEFQAGYAKKIIGARLGEWEKDGRLSAVASRRLEGRLEEPSLQEYLRGFGLHISLKLLTPVTSGIKALGFAWLVTDLLSSYPDLDPQSSFSLRLLSGTVAALLHNPLPLLLMANPSVLRTLITLWRMLKLRGSQVSFKLALLLGMVPVVGSLAFAAQMYRSCPELSAFLSRHIMSTLARLTPIYGGKHTRLEVWMVKLTNIPIELMELISGGKHSLYPQPEQIDQPTQLGSRTSGGEPRSALRCHQEESRLGARNQPAFSTVFLPPSEKVPRQRESLQK